MKVNEKQKEALSKVELTDVCNFYMGTLVQVTDPRTGRDTMANSIIIKRDTKLPVSETRRYYTIYENQTELEIVRGGLPPPGPPCKQKSPKGI